MIISSDNTVVNNKVTTYKCPVIGDGTVLLQPSKVKKYLGSYTKHKIMNFGILIPKNYILDIVNKETIDGVKWLLVNYKGYYYYTPAEYVDFNKIEINLSSLNTNIKPEDSFKSKGIATLDNSLNVVSGDGDYKRLYLYSENYKIGVAKKSTPLYGGCEENSNDIQYTMSEGEKCIIQSVWMNNKYNVKFFGTASFNSGACYGRYDNITFESKNEGHAIIYKDTPTKYGNGASHAALIRGDRTWPAYQDWNKGLHINVNWRSIDGDVSSATKGMQIYSYPANCASPIADSSDMFDKSLLGTLRVKKTATVYAMHRKSNFKLSYDKEYSLDNISISALAKCKPAKGIIEYAFNDVQKGPAGYQTNATSLSPSSTMIVTNYVTVFGMKCYVGFVETGATNGAVYFIILKDQAEGEDYIEYNPFPPKEVDNSGNIPLDGKIKDVNIDTSSKNNPPNWDDPTHGDGSTTNKFGETAYGVHLGLGDTSPHKVPWIQENAGTVPPDYSGWPITADTQNYNLSSEKPFDNRHLTHMNRFHLPTNMGGLSTKSFIFVTRPDLNLYKENDDETVDGWNMNPDLKRLATFKYLVRMRGDPSAPGIGNTIMNSLEYYGCNGYDSPWLSIFTNQAAGYTINDRELDIVELGETFHGNKVIYAEPTFKHKIAGTISIPFNERRDLTMYYTLRLWIDYIQAISMGFCKPRKVHRRNNELDYAVSLFYITTDETMENILYWEKLTGLIPLTVPDSFFDWNEGTPGREMKYNINFAYSFRTVMDELHLCELNNLYKKWPQENPKGMPIVPADNFNYVNNTGINQLLGRVATFYEKITDDDASLSSFINNEAEIRKYYYGGVLNKEGNAIQENNSWVFDGTGYHAAKFLPNYSMNTHTYGVPYVKGPFIEHNLDSQKYILRWV